MSDATLFKIVCRSSKLSLIQAGIASKTLEELFPKMRIEIVTQTTTGDADLSTPIYEMGDKNVFTKEIDQVLLSGKADFAVHSLKDLSGDRMMKDPQFKGVALEREDPRDIIIFNENVLHKLKNNSPITLGTSSLRRTTLTPSFLRNALPQYHPTPPIIETLPIRGNVDTRLRKLKDPSTPYDGIVLAAAGVNRLCSADATKSLFSELLERTMMMFLPLMDCPPAPGQGALWLECASHNIRACNILASFERQDLLRNLLEERAYAERYDSGCRQEFGVVTIDYKGLNLTNIAGVFNGEDISAMYFKVPYRLKNKRLYSTTENMKDFFNYRRLDSSIKDLNKKAFYIAHHRAIEDDRIINALKDKKIWTSGTRTWFELANKKVWVQGCADGFGLRFLDRVFQSPLVNIDKENMLLLTNLDSANGWIKEGYDALGTYELLDSTNLPMLDQLKKAEAVFWTNFRQYLLCKHFLQSNVLHLCPAGKTSELLIAEGIMPIVFPNIKAFLYWSKNKDRESFYR